MELEKIKEWTEEVITWEELEKLITGGGRVRGYIGVEPSGRFHIGWIIWVDVLRLLQRMGVEMTVLLATWHALINDKLGGDIKRIRACAEYIKACLEALGAENVKYIYAEELIGRREYWERVIRISKCLTLARVKRAMTIMGRTEKEASLDFSKCLYPPMQVSDIFELDVDIALGGMDQRRAHVLAREVAEKMKWKKVVAVHTPLLIGLEGVGRMDVAALSREEVRIQGKMSKSKPETAVFIDDSPEDIKRKIRKAFCPPGEVENNPVLEICKYIVFRRLDEMHIERPDKYGGPVTYSSYLELERDYVERKLHPADLKSGTAEALIKILEPVRDKLSRHKDLVAAIREAEITR